MQQITLTEYTESYAVSIEDGLPERTMAVFFKTKDGLLHQGQFFKSSTYWNNHFENLQGFDIEIEAVKSWHPVTVDM